MKHITYADKSLLIGDEAADTLIKYAAALGRKQISDSVDVAAISADGDGVTATFLLSASAPLMAETARSPLPEPDNTAVVHHMRKQIAALEHAPTGGAFTADDTDGTYDDVTES